MIKTKDKMKRNKYGHIIKGKINVKKLWNARNVVVGALNSFNIMLLREKPSEMIKHLKKVKNKLKKGLNKINKDLGIPVK